MTLIRAALPACLLVVGIAAAPAMAKTSVVHSIQICTTAMKAQKPAPKSVRIDNSLSSVSDDAATFTFDVHTADDNAGRQTCTVDRKTSKPSLGEFAKYD
ncbi:MAG: hypothetical protein GC155_16990 [Alphaproteobacteria bacterium]|nr:hypothetical protein [Alphaproteobacteria bacterium]